MNETETNETGWQIQQLLEHIHQIQEELTVLKFTYVFRVYGHLATNEIATNEKSTRHQQITLS